MSDITKKYRAGYWIFTILSWLLTIGPLIVFTIMGFIQGEPSQKVTLGITVMVAIVCVILSILMKLHIRSTIFILILGIYVCLDNILPLILTICICTIVDEILIQPIQKMYKSKLTINKEIDKRIT